MSGYDAPAGRIDRLRHELLDEDISVPVGGDLADAFFAELDYARHPHAHEGVSPRYGAILANDLEPDGMAGSFSFLDVGGVPRDVVRRLADGRSSFVVRTAAHADQLLCFDRTREYESSAVHLTTATGASVIQRLSRGWVRFTTADTVATWDGMRWAHKPLSTRIAQLVAPSLKGADPSVLANLLEFCVHWLGAGRIGATLVWRLDGDAHELAHLGFGSSLTLPPLELANRAHFAPLLNALSQFDRAALIDGRGHVSAVGVHLRTSERTRREIAPLRGTRHTSALRYSADVMNAAVFVVSSSGTFSLFWRGELLHAS